MFRVEEMLLFTRDAVIPDSLIVEDAKTFYPELAGFYVCLLNTQIPAIKAYMETVPNQSFVMKTFDDDPVNGLNLLLRLERKMSYTEEFVNYYGGVEGVLEAYKGVENETADAEASDADTTTVGDSIAEEHTDADEDTISDFIDPTIFATADDTEETEDVTKADLTGGAEDNSNEPFSPSDTGDNSGTMLTEALNNAESSTQFDELFLMIRGIACKLGVIDYDDTSILQKSDMRKAQTAIKCLSPITTQEGFLGALALAETQEDLAAVTRFLTLFYTYIRENNLKR